MKVLTRTGGVAGTNCHLVVDEVSKACVLFDAPDHTVGPLLDRVRVNGWHLDGLWLTHGHFDHVADHAVVREAFPDCRIFIHKIDEPQLQNPQTRFFQLPFTIPPGLADGYVEDNDRLQIGQIDVEVIFTPGHSPGHVMYHFPKHRVLIGGDLIIGGAIGRYDLPGADVQDLYASVRRVMQLPPDTQLLPGHGPATTLGDELQNNPYVRQIIQQQ